MHGGVAVALGGGGLEHARLHPLSQPQHVDGAEHAGLGGLHGVALVVDGRGRAGEVVDLVHLHIEREADVVADQLEVRVALQVRHVGVGPGVEVVRADDVAALAHQPLAQVRAEEAGPARDQDALL